MMAAPQPQPPLSPPPQTTAGRPFAAHPSTLPLRPSQYAHHSTRAPNAPSSGSQTITQTASVTRQPVLRLRGEDTDVTDESGAESGSTKRRRRIQWAEDVVDNEGLGRKSSKVCCIYHAPRNIDSSSDESSDSSSSDDSDSGDDGSARPVGGGKGKGHKGGHGHEHGDDCGHKARAKGKGRSRSPNAYEKQPTVKKAGSK